MTILYKLIKIIIVLLIIVFLGVLVMYFTKICPPAGPWPTPPWCASSSSGDFVYRHLDYLKPPEKAQKNFQLGVGTMDIWGNPHLFMNLGEDTVTNYEKTLQRIGQIGSKIYFFTDFINLSQGTSIQILDKETFPATYNIPQADLKKVVDAAKANGQERIIMLTNLSDTSNEIEGFISGADKAGGVKDMLMGRLFKEFTENKAGLTSAENLKSFNQEQWQEFLENYRTAMVNQAKKAESAGVTDFIINAGDVIIDYYYSGNLSDYWLSVRGEVKKVFSGRVGFFGYPDVLIKTDLTDYDFVVVYFDANGDKDARAIFSGDGSEIENLKSAWKKYFSRDFWNKIKAEKILLLTIPSYQGARTGGWIEPGAYHDDLNKDYAEQANLYESLFETANENKKVDDIISYGYWWSPNIYPQGKSFRTDLSHSIRNKDAENVFYYWAK